MFEGNIKAEHLRNRRTETGDGLALRRLEWAELVARVRASRECRDEIARYSTPAGGGFDQFREFASGNVRTGKPNVNRYALSNRSIAGPEESGSVIETASGDRGN